MNDSDITPRPTKKRHREVAASPVAPPENFDAYSQSSAASSELESHKSGRLSPTKQLSQLEDLDHPIRILDFEDNEVEMQQDVGILIADVELLADGIGEDEMADLHNLKNLELSQRELRRFSHPFANDFSTRRKTGNMPDLNSVRNLVNKAIKFSRQREHEHGWNEKVHQALIELALTTSRYANVLDMKSLKSAIIDPPTLAEAKLSRRVIDYAIVLLPDHQMKQAFQQLGPLAGVKSWNHTTTSNVRQTPIAINIETKAPNKSWTDGTAQLAIWTNAFFKRLQLLKKDKTSTLYIPAMPLVIAQGHDWYFLIISPDQGQTIMWQKLDIGSTRNLFDALKIIAVLHYLMQWAEKTWRPWFQKSFLGE